MHTEPTLHELASRLESVEASVRELGTEFKRRFDDVDSDHADAAVIAQQVVDLTQKSAGKAGKLDLKSWALIWSLTIGPLALAYVTRTPG
jgi:hypothetical protein